jgi:gliding motility-associated-like protein
MSVDANKQVFLGGTTKDTLTFNNNLSVAPQIAGDNTASSWVAQLDGSTNTGDWVWAKLAGSDANDNDRTGDICPDGFGNVYAIGFYEDNANFDGTILNSLGRKDVFVWKMSMTSMPPFTYNNTYDTIFADSMVFNAADTGLFTASGYVIDGCDTTFTDSVIHQKLGVRINYNINNPGTATFTIDGTVQAMPFSQSYWSGEAINIQVVGMQPNWLFSQWKSYNNTILPNVNSTTASFVANLSDSCVLYTYPKPPLEAFISGNDTICSNGDVLAQVLVSFSAAVEPYTFVYAINGINQPSITTTVNPYVINSNEGGTYTLFSFADVNEVGWVTGSAIITVQQAPTALFTTAADTLTILYPSLQLNDVSIGNISSWNWSFGDNTTNDFNQHPYHSYKDSLGIYQISLIVTDNLGCSDTTSKQLWIADEYWMYIPNSFTPDHDGVNDLFCLVHHGIRANTFHFNLFDRFSNLVYTTEKIAELECFLNANGWDGTHFKTGNDLPMGTYIYEVYYQDFQGWKHQDMGHLFIVR